MSPRPNGHVRRTPRGADLVITRRFRGDIKDVWQSVTDPESTARWIGPWEGEPGVGKTVRFCMSVEEGAPWFDARIEACEPPRHLVVTRSDERMNLWLELTLKSEGDVTELTFVQRLDDPKAAGDWGPGWEFYLDRLVASRSSEPMPDFKDYYPSQKEHYLTDVRSEG